MSTEQPDLEETIRLALEAAEAANDVSAEFSEIKRANAKMAEKLESFQKSTSRFVTGILLGAIVSIGLGGLVYFRSLQEMRTLSATYLEALTMFSEKVSGLQTTLDDAQLIVDKVDIANNAQAEQLANIEAKMAELQAAISTELTGFSDQATAMQPQMAESLQSHFDAGMTKTQDLMMAQISDLQLAMTKLLADGIAKAPAAKADATTKASAPAPSTSKKPAPRKSTKKTASTAKPATNPFKYP